MDEIGWRADETNSVPTPDDTRSLWGVEEDMGGLKELVVDLFVWYGCVPLLLLVLLILIWWVKEENGRADSRTSCTYIFGHALYTLLLQILSRRMGNSGSVSLLPPFLS